MDSHTFHWHIWKSWNVWPLDWLVRWFIVRLLPCYTSWTEPQIERRLGVNPNSLKVRVHPYSKVTDNDSELDHTGGAVRKSLVHVPTPNVHRHCNKQVDVSIIPIQVVLFCVIITWSLCFSILRRHGSRSELIIVEGDGHIAWYVPTLHALTTPFLLSPVTKWIRPFGGTSYLPQSPHHFSCQRFRASCSSPGLWGSRIGNSGRSEMGSTYMSWMTTLCVCAAIRQGLEPPVSWIERRKLGTFSVRR